MTGRTELRYEFVASGELDRAARALVRSGELAVRLVTATGAASLRIDGPCARCGHSYSQTRVLELPTSAVRGGQRPSAGTQRWADYLCDCEVAHPGAPAGVRGCGGSYSVVAPGGAHG